VPPPLPRKFVVVVVVVVTIQRSVVVVVPLKRIFPLCSAETQTFHQSDVLHSHKCTHR